MTEVATLDIFLHDAQIGTLTNIGGDRTIFAFADSYVNNSERPTLGLGFKDFYGQLRTEFRPYRKRVMPFFSNLLPEGRLREYLSEKAGVNPEREFHLLRALGRDLPGAIKILPSDGEDRLLESDDTKNNDHMGGNALRFSLAGVQMKFSAVQDDAERLTVPASGKGSFWIIKLPSREYAAIPENEFSMMTLAGMVGINVPRIGLVDVSNIKGLPENIGGFGNTAFIIERFDRSIDGEAVHIEDFAQVFGVYPEKKYKLASMRHIAKVLATEGSQADIAELIRRIVFNALIGNGDMHLKNWSLIYPRRRAASIAPAYDFVSTVPYIPNDNMGLKVSRTREFSELTEDELSHLSAKVAIPEKLVLDTARETVELFHEKWQSEKTNLPMTAAARKAVEANIADVPLAVPRSPAGRRPKAKRRKT